MFILCFTFSTGCPPTWILESPVPWGQLWSCIYRAHPISIRNMYYAPATSSAQELSQKFISDLTLPDRQMSLLKWLIGQHWRRRRRNDWWLKLNSCVNFRMSILYVSWYDNILSMDSIQILMNTQPITTFHFSSSHLQPSMMPTVMQRAITLFWNTWTVEIYLTLSKQRILLTRLMHVVFAIPSCLQSHIFILIR